MIGIFEIIIIIIPFIFGMIALALIPNKEKILKKQITSYRPEVLLLVYMIAFFILIMGAYYFMSFFDEMSEDQMINIFNGIFLEIIAIGIMAINHKNYSLLSETGTGLEERVEVAEVGEVEVAEVSEVESYDIEDEITTRRKSAAEDAELVECPKCSNVIKIHDTKRPIKISCPRCGVKGMIQ